MKGTYLPLLKAIYPACNPHGYKHMVKNGTPVWIGIAISNRSEDVWGPVVKEFKPERWLNSENPVEEKDARLSGVWLSVWVILVPLKRL